MGRRMIVPLDIFTWCTENHSSKSHVTADSRNGHYGWLMHFDYYQFNLLYWKASNVNRQPDKRSYISTGDVFIYLVSHGTEIWDFSGFNTTTEDL